ncbi:FAD-binding and (Fe-S)-binding domain-containing protein [Saccharicrinis sp. FJH2]|uniref:FAD-binding and (Fe-S)-binding domain-containing protein n=1 Tax=Saccharicrinis sp. FJH65 TaxID=3344659 RepID=UPI0035F4DDE5
MKPVHPKHDRFTILLNLDYIRGTKSGDMTDALQQLREEIKGDVHFNDVWRSLYATDASSYREKPLAVVIPETVDDIKKTIAFANTHKTSVIPRAAGTSLAGQVVGSGIAIDISKHLNRILELNTKEHWVKVEPGVNLAELNMHLKPHGLQFGPETSTANRCRVGGMLGNNSCGLHSLIYGSVRDHILEVDAILSDGSEVKFEALDQQKFEAKLHSENSLERSIYQNIQKILTDPELKQEIKDAYPLEEVHRRNMGYALDFLTETAPFEPTETPFNFCKLLAGSEGTLAFTKSMKLNLIPLPPKVKGVVAAHFNSLEEALKANIIALKYHPGAVEMMDDIIIKCTESNIEQRKNRFWLEGNPKNVLVIEFARETETEIRDVVDKMTAELEKNGYGYAFPLIFGDDKIKRVWDLRTAGLGLLSNVEGDRKSTTVIEDTAVAPRLLPDYINEFQAVLDKYGLQCVFYAHAGSGEIHLRPLLNLKVEEDRQLYQTIAEEIAKLVKKYRGSLSGEHGDGRLRGHFIPFMYGDKIYRLFKDIKQTWDPNNIFNPGKIVDVPPITESLRYLPSNRYPEIETVSDFTPVKGFLRAVEKCNGSGDCRKSEFIGGTMCPTYMATRDEDKSTRGRSNLLREHMHHSTKPDPLDQQELYDILDLCISCKACKSECPANIDMARFKAEFLQHYYDIHGIPFRSGMIAYLPVMNRLIYPVREMANLVQKTTAFKKLMGFAPKRTLPMVKRQLTSRVRQTTDTKDKLVYLYADEFTNMQEPETGLAAIALLNKLGYHVVIPKLRDSGRTYISKGLLRKAKQLATDNIMLLKDLISSDHPLIGLEPSTILSFRDEYPELVDKHLQEDAKKVAGYTMLFEEFFMREAEAGRISKASFSAEPKTIRLHGHCQQKAVASTTPTLQMLSFPENYSVEEFKTGCCGMAGSFGYEKEHYDLSMQIGEMILFPEVRKSNEETILAAPGTSCRHHIKDGTGKSALHPVEIMLSALK